MRIIRVEPFEGRTQGTILEKLAEALEKEKGLRLLKAAPLGQWEQRRLEGRLGEREINFPGNTLVLVRVHGSSKNGRLEMFAVRARNIKANKK